MTTPTSDRSALSPAQVLLAGKGSQSEISLNHEWPDALREAVLALDASGYLPGNYARALRVISETQTGLAQRVMEGPDKFMGPFASLTPEAQKAVVDAVAAEDRWRMRGHKAGDWHIRLSRFFTELRGPLSRYGLDRMSGLAEVFALASQSGPAFLLHSVYKGLLSCRGRLPLRQTLPSLLSSAGIDPRALGVCYARYMQQPAEYRGFYHDSALHNTCGVLLGIDLLPAAEGFWYIESNLDFGMSRNRAALYERDPFVTNLVAFAKELGYRNLMIVHKSSSYMNEGMVRQYEEEAGAGNIKLTIVEDAYLPPRSGCMQSFQVPPCDGNDTLVVRAKYYPTSLDYLFQHKNASIRALTAYGQNSAEPALLVPRIGGETVLEDVKPDDPFPNLVYKFPERDEGKGVIFIKAESPGHASRLLEDSLRENRPRGILGILHAMAEDGNGLYQPYIRSRMLPGRRLYKVRAHVLVSPAGVRFLSAHRVVSQYEVPGELPPGIVEDRRPYLVNLSTSSNYEIVPPEEEPQVIEAALAVARGLAWAAAYGFDTGAAEGGHITANSQGVEAGGRIAK